MKKIVNILLMFMLMTVLSLNFSSESYANFSVQPKVSVGVWSSYALKSDGTVWAWGNNGSGRLGDNTTTSRLVPTQISTLSSIIDIASGEAHGLALKSDGTVWSWGRNNVGQLGDGTITTRKSPVQVPNLNNVISIAANEDSSFALKSDGTLMAWGSNSYKKLGIGNITSSQKSPVPVHNLSNVTKMTMGLKNGAAIKQDGSLWTWGQNDNGQIGDNTIIDRNSAVQVTALNSVVFVAAGNLNMMAIKSDGTVWNWGEYKTNGSIDYTQYREPHLVPINNARFIATNQGRAFVIKNDNTLWAFGYNIGGKNGIGDITYEIADLIPAQVVLSDLVTPLVDVDYVTAGANHALAVKTDGTVWAWGLNTESQLGDGTTVTSPYAKQVIGLNLLDHESIAIGNSKNIDFLQTGSKKFVFIPEQSGQVTFTTSQWNSPCDPMLTLYDANNNVLMFNDDDGNSLYETITYNVVAGQRYVIEVSGYQGTAVNCILTVS